MNKKRLFEIAVFHLIIRNSYPPLIGCLGMEILSGRIIDSRQSNHRIYSTEIVSVYFRFTVPHNLIWQSQTERECCLHATEQSFVLVDNSMELARLYPYQTDLGGNFTL